MTPEDIIHMAKEAGFHENTAHTVLVFYNYAQFAPSAELTRFAHLVAAKEREELAVAAPTIPAGYCLVPCEPTEAIERAYYWQQEKSGTRNCYPVWKAMIAAAPKVEGMKCST